MAASSSGLWLPKMNDMPPSVASETARRGPETACMMAETIGMFREMRGSSPRRNLARGVRRLTFSGMHSEEL